MISRQGALICQVRQAAINLGLEMLQFPSIANLGILMVDSGRTMVSSGLTDISKTIGKNIDEFLRGFITPKPTLAKSKANFIRTAGAQAYQSRAIDVINAMRKYSANPELEMLLNNVFTKELDVESASPKEQSRLRSHFYFRRTDLDNEHYQFQNGFLDPDFYHTTTEREIKAFAPYWRAFGIPEPRQQFAVEVDRILADPTIKSALD